MDAPSKAVEIKALIVGVIGFLTALWGYIGWAVVIWLCCILMDYIAGSLAAKQAGEWSSAIARQGLWHKLGEIFAVCVAALCDIALNVIIHGAGIAISIEIGSIITPVVLLWYIITELGSIIENCGKMGAPIPNWLRKSLKQYKQTIDTQQGETPPVDNPEETE